MAFCQGVLPGIRRPCTFAIYIYMAGVEHHWPIHVRRERTTIPVLIGAVFNGDGVQDDIQWGLTRTCDVGVYSMS